MDHSLAVYMDECEERWKDSTSPNLHYRPLFFLYRCLHEESPAEILSTLLTLVPGLWSHSVKGAVDYPRQGWNWYQWIVRPSRMIFSLKEIDLCWRTSLDTCTATKFVIKIQRNQGCECSHSNYLSTDNAARPMSPSVDSLYCDYEDVSHSRELDVLLESIVTQTPPTHLTWWLFCRDICTAWDWEWAWGAAETLLEGQASHGDMCVEKRLKRKKKEDQTSKNRIKINKK